MLRYLWMTGSFRCKGGRIRLLCCHLSPYSSLIYKLHYRLPVGLAFSRVMALPDCSLPVAWTAFSPQAPCLDTQQTLHHVIRCKTQREMREVTKTAAKLKDYFLKSTKVSQQKTGHCIQYINHLHWVAFICFCAVLCYLLYRQLLSTWNSSNYLSLLFYCPPDSSAVKSRNYFLKHMFPFGNNNLFCP